MAVPFGRLRPLTVPLKFSGGRNQRGRITVRHRGGRGRLFYRLLAHNYPFPGVPALVVATTVDTYRRRPLLLLAFRNGHLAYGPQTLGLGIGSLLCSYGDRFRFAVGSAFPLRFLPLAAPLHHLQGQPAAPIAYVRSPAAAARILKQGVGRAAACTLVRLPSGRLRLFSDRCLATYGRLAAAAPPVSLAKAGTNRRRGWRPAVRGVAMNPIDHPHGGGQGKTSGGRPSVSPWGRPTKGAKTRSRRRNRFVVSFP